MRLCWRLGLRGLSVVPGQVALQGARAESLSLQDAGLEHRRALEPGWKVLVSLPK